LSNYCTAASLALSNNWAVNLVQTVIRVVGAPALLDVVRFGSKVNKCYYVACLLLKIQNKDTVAACGVSE
jgi:hypothetical protein